jgi:hypothetical protein
MSYEVSTSKICHWIKRDLKLSRHVRTKTIEKFADICGAKKVEYSCGNFCYRWNEIAYEKLLSLKNEILDEI